MTIINHDDQQTTIDRPIVHEDGKNLDYLCYRCCYSSVADVSSSHYQWVDNAASNDGASPSQPDCSFHYSGGYDGLQ